MSNYHKVKEVEKSIQLKIGKISTGRFTLITETMMEKLHNLDRLVTSKVFLKMIQYSGRKFLGKFCAINLPEFCDENGFQITSIYRDVSILENSGLIFTVKIEKTHYIFFPDLYDNFLDAVVRITIGIFCPYFDMEKLSELLGNYMNKMKELKRMKIKVEIPEVKTAKNDEKLDNSKKCIKLIRK
jgi:hypothetical protein